MKEGGICRLSDMNRKYEKYTQNFSRKAWRGETSWKNLASCRLMLNASWMLCEFKWKGSCEQLSVYQERLCWVKFVNLNMTLLLFSIFVPTFKSCPGDWHSWVTCVWFSSVSSSKSPVAPCTVSHLPFHRLADSLFINIQPFCAA
jgi:hypothetical protein